MRIIHLKIFVKKRTALCKAVLCAIYITVEGVRCRKKPGFSGLASSFLENFPSGQGFYQAEKKERK
jgi:hypothetical protein